MKPGTASIPRKWLWGLEEGSGCPGSRKETPDSFSANYAPGAVQALDPLSRAPERRGHRGSKKGSDRDSVPVSLATWGRVLT